MKGKGRASYTDWLSNRRDDLQRNGLSAVRRVRHDLSVEAARRLTQMAGKDGGERVLERKWDVLVILDACRYDLFTEVASDYEFVVDGEVGSIWSAGSTSDEWLQSNFSPDVTHDNVAMISGNPFTDNLDSSGIDYLDEVWRDSWDEDLHTIRPRPITERAVRYARDHDYKRLVIHYMQPHAPFLENPGLRPPEYEEDIWRSICRGYVNKSEVWEAYKTNLRRILDEISILRENIDANRLVISSDHGNATGEWGFYGHPGHLPLRCLRQVPWVVTTATDSRSLLPTKNSGSDVADDVEGRLRDLGYI